MKRRRELEADLAELARCVSSLAMFVEGLIEVGPPECEEYRALALETLEETRRRARGVVRRRRHGQVQRLGPGSVGVQAGGDLHLNRDVRPRPSA